MKITIIGAGPAGLYFALLAKKQNPHYDISVYERNGCDDAFGFGVVFSDETLQTFLHRDAKSYDLICNHFAYWDNLDISYNGKVVTSTGHGFCGCSRKTLLNLLQKRCEQEGIVITYNMEINDLSAFSDSHMILASDGISSLTRDTRRKQFGTKIKMRKNKFVWLGSSRPLDAFTYFFKNTEHGMIVAHSYQYENSKSTWIFEMAESTWEKFGFDTFDAQDTVQKLEKIYADELMGHGLMSNKSYWRNFPYVVNKNWWSDNILLIGDAKATAHYSIGSGTRLAMLSAIALADAVGVYKDATPHLNTVQNIFKEYERRIRPDIEKIQHTANVSLRWFENMDVYSDQDMLEFVFNCMTRSKQITYQNLKFRDTKLIDTVVSDFFNRHTNGDTSPKIPLLAPFTIGQMQVKNRVVMSPMGQYSADDGVVNDWHLTHYGARAIGGTGLIVCEMTAVSKNSRITKGCAGLWNDQQTNAWARVVDFVHNNSTAKIGIQLGHSGAKGSANRLWEGMDTPLTNGGWDTVSASALAYNDVLPPPVALTEKGMEQVILDFVNATKNADTAGFDMVELQACHGFLLASFLSPLTNQRSDLYGGDVYNRLKFPLSVFTAMRSTLSSHKPMSVRLSVHDWAKNGITEQDAVIIAKAFKDAGADIINVTTGKTVSYEKPVMGRMWQVPFSHIIRIKAGVPTITTGHIENDDQANTILLAGRADMVAFGRAIMNNPNFVRDCEARHKRYDTVLNSDVALQYRLGWIPLCFTQQFTQWQYENMRLQLKPKSHNPKT